MSIRLRAATPILTDHHKKGGSKARAGQKDAATSGAGARASQKAAKQKAGAPLGAQEGEPVKPSGEIGVDLPVGMP